MGFFVYKGVTFSDQPMSGGGAVSSVNTQIGDVVLDADDVAATATNEYLTNAAPQTITGDKTFSGAVKIVNQAQLGSAILTVPTSDYYILSLVETSSGTTWENWIEDGGYGGTVGSLYWDVVAGASGTSGAVVFGPDGRLGIGIGYTVVGAALDILSKSPTIFGLRIKGAVGQSADLIRIMDSDGVNKFLLTAAGDVGIGTDTPLGALDVSSTTQGFVPPRMTTIQKNAISSPVEGTMVYDSALHRMFVYADTGWIPVASSVVLDGGNAYSQYGGTSTIDGGTA